MATEDASYISELNAAYPADGDAVGEGGGTTTGTGSTRGHLNMIKYALKTQFSGLTGTTAITSSEAELNVLDGIPATLTATELGYVDGVTSAIQTQIDNFSGGLSWQAVVTSETTMVAGNGYFANTTGGAFSMILPASATLGDECHIIDYAGTFDTNNCTVDRNSHNILGAGSDLVVATERAAFKLVYVDATQGWLLTEL